MSDSDHSSLAELEEGFRAVKFTQFTMFLLVVGLIPDWVDWVLDYLVARMYYDNGQYWHLGLTLLFVICPTYIASNELYIEIILFWKEYSPDVYRRLTTFERSALYTICLMQLGPLFVTILHFYYGLRYRNCTDEEDKYNAFIRMIEIITIESGLPRLQLIESASQLGLQLYIQMSTTSFDSLSKCPFPRNQLIPLYCN